MQKALIIPNKFDAFVLSTIERYTAAPGEVLIKIHSAGLNPVDWKIQRYGAFFDELYGGKDAILGTDIAGEIEEVGEGVTRLKKGDRVVAQSHFNSKTSAFQQYAIAPEAYVGKIPDNVTFDGAASIPVAFGVVWSGLYAERPHGAGYQAPLTPEAVGRYDGVPIFVLGGSSSVGQYAIQLASLSGFSPIITTSSLKHADYLKSLGATKVISRSLSDDEIITTTKSILGEKDLRLVYDAISSESTTKLGAKLLSKRGNSLSTLVIVLKGAIKEEDAEGAAVVEGFSVVNAPCNAAIFEDLYQRALPRWLNSGDIKPNRVEVLPNGLAGIPEGLKRMENDQVSGVKLIAHPQETA